MHKEPSNDNYYTNSCIVPASRTWFIISKPLKKARIVENICFFNVMLWFIIEKLALAICIDRSNMVDVLGRTSWVVTQCNL